MLRLLSVAALAAALLAPLAPAPALAAGPCDNSAAVRSLQAQKRALERQLHAMPPPQRRANRAAIEAQRRSLDVQIRGLREQREACRASQPKHRKPGHHGRDHDHDRDDR